MAKSIRYKRRPDSDVLALYPKEVKVIVIQDRNFYEPFSYARPNEEAVTGFVKKLIKGRISLFRSEDRYFVTKRSDELHEITRRAKQLETYLIADDYSGLGVLRAMVNDCSSITEQLLLDNISKDETGFRKIINTYNACFPEGSVEMEDIKVRAHLSLGILASVNGSQLSFANTDAPQAHFNWSTSVGGGAFLSLFHPDMGNNLRFVVEPSFGQNRAYSNFDFMNTNNDLFIKYSFVRAPILFRYFHKNLFFDIGLTNLIVINSDCRWRRESVDISSNLVVTENGPNYRIKSNFAGLTGGIGMKLKIGDKPVLTSLRFSRLFVHSGDLATNQPIVKWVDLNVALQLTR